MAFPPRSVLASRWPGVSCNGSRGSIAMFAVGSKVVHPCYGAGTIVHIQEK